MNALWMFYPENDIALAYGSRYFTAPHNAALLRARASFLLSWIADEGDMVIYDEIPAGWEASVQERFRILSRRYDPSYKDASITTLCPWGWSPASAEILRRYGINPDIIPPDDAIDRIRSLSHRRTSIAINRMLREAGIATPPLPVEISDTSTLTETIASGERYMFKAPWSSSGRGVIDSATLPDGELQRRLSGIIRRQGCIIAERYLDKKRDFAMLFKIQDGKARLSGLSLFFNEHGEAYSGNIVARQPILRDILSHNIDITLIDRIGAALEEILTQIIGDAYSGYCGIDMMIYRDVDSSVAIAPCIELNLRMTMGIVALKLAERHIGENSVGRMYMTSAPPDGEDYAPEIVDCQLVKGRISLVPPNDKFCFYLEVK